MLIVAAASIKREIRRRHYSLSPSSFLATIVLIWFHEYSRWCLGNVRQTLKGSHELFNKISNSKRQPLSSQPSAALLEQYPINAKCSQFLFGNCNFSFCSVWVNWLLWYPSDAFRSVLGCNIIPTINIQARRRSLPRETRWQSRMWFVKTCCVAQNLLLNWEMRSFRTPKIIICASCNR